LYLTDESPLLINETENQSRTSIRILMKSSSVQNIFKFRKSWKITSALSHIGKLAHFFTFLFAIAFSFIPSAHSWAQSKGANTIRGSIVDVENNEPLPGVSITVKGTILGTVTDSNGRFELMPKGFPVTLDISLVGFRTQEVEVPEASAEDLAIQLTGGSVLGQEVVVTASRVQESIMKSPVSIEKLDLTTIKESPAPTFFDALENVKGVQMTTTSIGYKVPNTRGFNSTTNTRFLQMVDGVDTQAPAIGASIANAVGPSELDIESTELIPGSDLLFMV